MLRHNGLMLRPHNPSKNLRAAPVRPEAELEDVHIVEVPSCRPQDQDGPVGQAKASGRTEAFNRRPD